MNSMSVGSLFSGVGGIEIGFEDEGYDTKWFVERDEYAKAILRKQFPNATIYDDVTAIDWTTVPKVDILTGGFPCQDISNAGKRVGITGSRSSLWRYYCEAIRIIRPKYALIENVAALTQRGLNVVLSDLAKIGYDAEWYNLSASAVGALHRRERIFIIAYPVRSRPSRFQQPNENAISSSQNKRQSVVWPNMYDNLGIQNIPENIRMDDGIPNRVDRIKCLGNAVVPQCAQVFAQAIKEYEAIK